MESLLHDYLSQPPAGRQTGILLEDSGYACTNVLLTPLRNPVGRQQEAYNKCVYYIHICDLSFYIHSVMKITFRINVICVIHYL